MINDVTLIGRLTKDPELRTTGSGVSVTTFTLAVDRQYTNSQGERGADFINCVIWRKAAETFNNYTHKGSLVGINGRLQSRSYDNNDGQRVYVTEVVIDNFSFLDSRNKEQENKQSKNNTQSQSGIANRDKAQKQANTTPPANNAPDPFADDSSNSIDISDDDLPF